MEIKWYDDFNEGNLWYIMKILVEIIFIFAEDNIYLEDLNTENIVFIFDWQDRAIIRIIDLENVIIDTEDNDSEKCEK